MTIAAFNYDAWAARYPELAGSVDADLAALYFAEAELYCANTDCAVVPADAVTFQPRLMLLNMLVAHIAKLNAPIGGEAPSGLVGRIASATQGSVSVSAAMEGQPGSAAWYNQTTYGATYWRATARYRTARYVPPPPYGPVGGFPWPR